MIHLLFAEDDKSWLMSFFNQWGNAASVIGLVITLIGFGLILRGQWKIRRATEETVRRVALQVAAAELGTILRLSTGVREANVQGQYELALYQCREAGSSAQSLSHNPHIDEGHSQALRDAALDLGKIVKHMVGQRSKHGKLAALTPYQARRLEAVITILADMNGRMQNAVLEV
ncbi:MAG TPA: hypothetical protein VKA46_35720 [Gemmataceae bacterium]|nr:hypothetical protein [Gemmataceae bacterium]